MDITITGRGVGIPDRFEDYATEKAEKVEHLAPKSIALEIKVCRHHETHGNAGDDRVELTLIGPGPIVRAEAGAGDKYAAFDLAIDKLIERIRQAKDRRKVHRGQHRPTSLREASADGFSVTDITPASADLIDQVATGSVPVTGESEEDWSPVVIRHKVFPSTRMTQTDAVDHMELVGHDFFLFIDAETDRPSVVYRRKGWDYGVIGLEETADELAARR
ncbi:ribosome hibernation-promoting factor, HPF/YfiA family [Homoserinibacter sp. YIM 151385]|uniref:ribosome hibernation-promoting factor, HPF/YfiA family n=1 Tax=Homoserinibacter sp. YIM 151385 TaxID=2985506 RepID=UPI0022F0608E|nr:ribosome-associated translation inhibitor RaiA [Homoserinibacter sp. YIM 151385]WBU37815.1 ribosome-associated translation inhibitor RaiA [Homoserinibacter sp. YIM 151385]